MLSVLETARLLPHEAPMVFIDQGVEVAEEHAVSITTMTPDHFTAVNGRVPAYIGMEMMAQTIALWAGFLDQQQQRAPSVGFLLGTRRYESDVAELPLHVPIYTRVERDLEADNGLSSFCCELSVSGAVICRARINVFKTTE